MVEIRNNHLLDRVLTAFQDEVGYLDIDQLPGWLRAKGFDVRLCRDEYLLWFRFDDDREATRFCLYW